MRDRLIEVLGKHRLHTSLNICMGCDWRPIAGAGPLNEQHRAHLADVLADHVRAKQAEALREAAEAYPTHVRNQDEFWSYNTTRDAVEEIGVEYLRDRADRLRDGA